MVLFKAIRYKNTILFIGALSEGKQRVINKSFSLTDFTIPQKSTEFTSPNVLFNHSYSRRIRVIEPFCRVGRRFDVGRADVCWFNVKSLLFIRAPLLPRLISFVRYVTVQISTDIHFPKTLCFSYKEYHFEITTNFH